MAPAMMLQFCQDLSRACRCEKDRHGCPLERSLTQRFCNGDPIDGFVRETGNAGVRCLQKGETSGPKRINLLWTRTNRLQLLREVHERARGVERAFRVVEAAIRDGQVLLGSCAPVDGTNAGMVTRGALETLFAWNEDEGNGLGQDLCPTWLRSWRERRESHDSPKAEALNGNPKVSLSFDLPEPKQNMLSSDATGEALRLQ